VQAMDFPPLPSILVRQSEIVICVDRKGLQRETAAR
jgi:hypothetical protein